MRTMLVLLASLSLAGAAAAGSGCETTEPTLTIHSPAGTFYVVNEICQPGCLFSVWVYEESNGEPGLQRGCDGACEPDDCPVEADTILF